MQEYDTWMRILIRSLKEGLRIFVICALLWRYGSLEYAAFQDNSFTDALLFGLSDFMRSPVFGLFLGAQALLLLWIVGRQIADFFQWRAKTQSVENTIQERASVLAEHRANLLIQRREAGFAERDAAQVKQSQKIRKFEEELFAREQSVNRSKQELDALRRNDLLWKGQRQALLGRINTALHLLRQPQPNTSAAVRHLKAGLKEKTQPLKR